MVPRSDSALMLCAWRGKLNWGTLKTSAVDTLKTTGRDSGTPVDLPTPPAAVTEGMKASCDSVSAALMRRPLAKLHAPAVPQIRRTP